MGINFKVAAKLSQLRFLVFQGMAGKSPRVNNETGHWETYDNDAQDWADTGTKAQGDKGDPGTPGVSPTVTIEPITGGHRVTITDKIRNHTFDVMDGDPGDDYVLTPQDKAEIAGMVPVPTVPTEDISANTAARHTHENKAVLDGITAAKVQSWDGKGTYSKPNGGIPISDLAAAVKTSLSKADTALQQHQSLADYATVNYVQTQIASIPDELPSVTATDNGKFLRVVSGTWAAQTVQTWQGGSY